MDLDVLRCMPFTWLATNEQVQQNSSYAIIKFSAIISALRPSMWWRSKKCTSLPSLNKAMAGLLGGYGRKCLRAWLVASVSTPAKTVTSLSGRLAPFNDSFAPGRAAPAAQPHTLFTTHNTVPGWVSALSTCSGVCRSWKPTEVRSVFIGATNSAGYMG